MGIFVCFGALGLFSRFYERWLDLLMRVTFPLIPAFSLREKEEYLPRS